MVKFNAQFDIANPLDWNSGQEAAAWHIADWEYSTGESFPEETETVTVDIRKQPENECYASDTDFSRVVVWIDGPIRDRAKVLLAHMTKVRG